MPLFGAPGPVTPAATPPGGPSPVSPGPQEGLRAQARVKLGQSIKGMIDALGMLKSDIGSEEGKAIIAALKILQPVVPEVAEGLGQSEMAAMMGQAAAVRPGLQGGGGPPPGMLGMGGPRPSVVSGPPMR